MGQSLFEFANENPKGKTEDKKEINEKALKQKFDQYSKLSQGELLDELFSQVEKQKQSGEFNFEKIANQIEGIKPMLSNEQIKNINKLLNQIK